MLLVAADSVWTCHQCIARTLGVPVRQVKIALLRLARFRGRDYVETGCEVCEGCEEATTVVRLGRRGDDVQRPA